MKVYIQTDIEGVAGFCFFEQRRRSEYEVIEHRHRMYRLLTAEVNAAVRAAFDAGADEVIVNDSHGSGYNILFEELDSRCRIIHGRNCSGPHWLPLLEGSDAMLLVGMHAMAGTPRAITAHSKWEINNGKMYLSEGTMACAIAGDFGVPAVMMSGDDKVASEFREKIPSMETAVVKEALSPYQACSLVPAAACGLIYQKALKGLERRKEIPPFKISGPVTLGLFDSDNHAPPFQLIGERKTAETINQAFLDYERAMPWCPFDQEMVDGFQYP
ncbi:MAG: M55 family metallopeptidase [Lentisphaeria bacterium]|nr:M55 family metallopeptidase [Lentisphaeria bacterium]